MKYELWLCHEKLSSCKNLLFLHWINRCQDKKYDIHFIVIEEKYKLFNLVSLNNTKMKLHFNINSV